MTNCSSRTQIAAKKGGKNSAAVALAAMTNTLPVLAGASSLHEPGSPSKAICVHSFLEERDRGGFLGQAKGRAGVLVEADHTPGYFGTSNRGCILGKENDAFCLLSWKIKYSRQDQ